MKPLCRFFIQFIQIQRKGGMDRGISLNLQKIMVKMLSKVILEKIEERFGRKLQYPRDVSALQQHIFEQTKENLGDSTLKRMFGFVGYGGKNRQSTMDVIATYCGYHDYKQMAIALGEDYEVSDFESVDEIVTADLEQGTMIQISYDPGRVLVLTYIGDGYYIVNESVRSQLMKGDKVKISHLTIGFRLISSEVIRSGRAIGSYVSAKEGGLTSVEIIG